MRRVVAEAYTVSGRLEVSDHDCELLRKTSYDWTVDARESPPRAGTGRKINDDDLGALVLLAQHRGESLSLERLFAASLSSKPVARRSLEKRIQNLRSKLVADGHRCRVPQAGIIANGGAYKLDRRLRFLVVVPRRSIKRVPDVGKMGTLFVWRSRPMVMPNGTCTFELRIARLPPRPPGIDFAIQPFFDMPLSDEGTSYVTVLGGGKRRSVYTPGPLVWMPDQTAHRPQEHGVELTEGLVFRVDNVPRDKIQVAEEALRRHVAASMGERSAPK